MLEFNGKKYYDEEEANRIAEEAKAMRRAGDLTMREMLEKFNDTLKFVTNEISGNTRIVSEFAQQQKYIRSTLDCHEEIIRGKGSYEGLATSLSKAVGTLDAVSKDVWDRERGLPAINAKLDVIIERKKDYDANLIEMKKVREELLPDMRAATGKLRGKLNTMSAVWGIVAGAAGFLFEKVIEYFIKGGGVKHP